MGNADTKLHFRKAVIQLTTRATPVDAADEQFWEQFWSDSVNSVQDVFALVPSAEIRAVREESPSNLATLCYKAVEKLVAAADASCRTQNDHLQVLNSVRLLTRVLPYIFEDPNWRGFFWSSMPGENSEQEDGSGRESHDNAEVGRQSMPLAQSLLNAVADLLFCPEFTVAPNRKGNRDEVDDLQSLDSCEYIWAEGVGFSQTPASSPQYDINRRELLRLLSTCFSETMYLPPLGEEHSSTNRWVQYFTSSENRHALPLFTSLLNTVCGYDPGGILPYNHLLFADSREETVEAALQVLIITLDQDSGDDEESGTDNLFLNYLSRIHREEDFQFVLKGVTRLLKNPLEQTYLPHSQRKIQFHQELLIFFWKFCEHNRKFLFFVLKSMDALDIMVPILHQLNDARADQSRIGLMHIGVFILLLLSGERNFGVRLNKPFTSNLPLDIPVFTGTHADLLIIVFHKIITTGHQRLQPLFDCLLTILCNVSPYIKSMSMIAACKLLHLLEAFATPWFLFSNSTNHLLVFFLLEIFNNIIQYQFDGNSNLIYTIIRKRQVFHTLANIPADCGSINKSLTRRAAVTPNPSKKNGASKTPSTRTPAISTSTTVLSDHQKLQTVKPSDMSHLKATLIDLPGIEKMTEKESAHPSQKQLDKLTKSSLATPLFATGSEYSDLTKQLSSSDTFEPNLLSPTEGLSKKIPGAAKIAKLPEVTSSEPWVPTQEWVQSWKNKLPLQTIMRLLQVLVPQVEKICIDKNLTDETEILRFLQHGTLVGLLPVPHPILIRKYQQNPGTAMWFRTYMWGVIYLRNTDPPIWYDTDVRLFEIQRVQ